MAHLWARWPHKPCRLREPLRFRAGDKIRSGPLVGKVATLPLLPPGAPPLQSGGQNQKWPTCGQSSYITPAASGSRSASVRGAESQMAHLLARWLHYPARFDEPLCFRAGGKMITGPLVGKVVTSPLPPWGTPSLQSGEHNQKWRTCGQGGHISTAASGSPSASERGAKS